MDRGRSPSRRQACRDRNSVASAESRQACRRPKSNGLGEGTGREPLTPAERQSIAVSARSAPATTTSHAEFQVPSFKFQVKVLIPLTWNLELGTKVRVPETAAGSPAAGPAWSPPIAQCRRGPPGIPAREAIAPPRPGAAAGDPLRPNAR